MTIVLNAFNTEEEQAVQEGLEDLVRALRIVGGGARIVEGHWNHIYSTARKSSVRPFSPLPFRDYYSHCLGVESKLKQDTASYAPITRLVGANLSAVATRQIAFDPNNGPTACKDKVLEKFGEQIDEFRQRVNATCQNGKQPELRFGILIWRTALTDFLYFEEEIVNPAPAKFWAEFERGKAVQADEDDNLWIYEAGKPAELKYKRYSVTMPKHGAKLSPYFIVPPIGQGTYHFRVSPNELHPAWLRKETVEALHEAAAGQDLNEVVIAALDALRRERSTAPPDLASNARAE